jgi:TonB family protein
MCPAFCTDKRAVELNNDGVRAISKKDWTTALEKLEEALKIEPTYGLALENLSIAYNNSALAISEKQPTEAADKFCKALFYSPDSETARENLNTCISSLGKDPKSYEDRVKLGDEASARKEYMVAFVEYRAARSIKQSAQIQSKIAEVTPLVGADAVKAMESRAFRASVQKKVLDRWHEHHDTKYGPTFALKIGADGKIESVKLTKSSGRNSLDAFGSQLIRDCEPFSAPPDKAEVMEVSLGEIDFGPYMTALQRHIKRHWFPPRGQESKEVQVVFKVHNTGRLSDLHLTKTCDSDAANEAAKKAVESAAPFQALPIGTPENVDIQFTFDYNVFSKKDKNEKDEADDSQPRHETSETASTGSGSHSTTHESTGASQSHEAGSSNQAGSVNPKDLSTQEISCDEPVAPLWFPPLPKHLDAPVKPFPMLSAPPSEPWIIKGSSPLVISLLTSTQGESTAHGGEEHNTQSQEAARRGEWDKAVREGLLAVANSPRNTDYAKNASLATSAYGSQLQKSGKVDQALRAFRLALLLDPTNSTASSALDGCLKKAGKDPENAAARRALSEELESAGDLESAVVEQQKVVQLDDTPQARARLGDLLKNSGMIVTSYAEYRNAVLKPWPSGENKQLAIVHQRMADILKLFALSAKDRGRGTLGMVRLLNAANEYRRATTLDPKNSAAIAGLTECARQIVDINSSFTNQLMLAGAYMLAHDFRHASKDLNNCAALRPTDSQLDQAKLAYWFLLGTFAGEGDRDLVTDAVSAAQKASLSSSEDAKIFFALSLLYKKNGNSKGYDECIAKAQKLSSSTVEKLKDTLTK